MPRSRLGVQVEITHNKLSNPVLQDQAIKQSIARRSLTPMAIDFAYEVSGEGPAIFFIHGIGARRSGWAKVIEALRDRYTCISYDLRGHGDAPMPQHKRSLQILSTTLKRFATSWASNLRILSGIRWVA